MVYSIGIGNSRCIIWVNVTYIILHITNWVHQIQYKYLRYTLILVNSKNFASYGCTHFLSYFLMYCYSSISIFKLLAQKKLNISHFGHTHFPIYKYEVFEYSDAFISWITNEILLMLNKMHRGETIGVNLHGLEPFVCKGRLNLK